MSKNQSAVKIKIIKIQKTVQRSLHLGEIVSSLLYGTRAMLVLNLPAFENKKIHNLWPFPYGEIPTEKEPIRTLGFTSRLPCHVIIEIIFAGLVWRKEQQKNLCGGTK